MQLDTLNQLAAWRPSETQLYREWEPESRARVLDRVLADGMGAAPRSTGRMRRGRNAPVLWIAAAVVIVTGLLTGPALMPGGGGSPAYAVTIGNHKVRIHVVRMSDSSGLERALADKGVHADVTYLPAGYSCAPGRYEDASVLRGGTMSFRASDGGFELDVDAGSVASTQTLVLEMSRSATSGDQVAASTPYAVGLASGPVSRCLPAVAPPPSPTNPTS